MSTSNNLGRIRFGMGLILLSGACFAGCKPAAVAPPVPPPPIVTVARPGSAQVQSYLEYNGYLDAVEKVEIRARVKGYLTEVFFKEGDEVKKGDPLFAIDPREYASGVAKSKSDIARADADIANAKAQIKLGQAEYDRMRGLVQSSGVSRSDLDKAEAVLAANKAQLDVAIANKGSAEAALRTSELQLSYTDIRAPLSGQISRSLVSRGNLVGQTDSTLLTTIVSVDRLDVYFDEPERDLFEYQRSLLENPKANPTLPVEVGVATEIGYPHLGVIDFRENRVDTGTGTVRMRGKVPNPKMPPGNARLLYPGLFARVRVPAGPSKQQLVLPEDALMTGQEGRFLYVVGPENKVIKRTVTVGPQVWRAPASDAPAAPGWVLVSAKPAPTDAKGSPADAKPSTADAKAGPGSPVRSIVAIESGLAPGDLVIVNGLQKARPGAPVTPDEWNLVPPVIVPAKAK